MLAGDPLKEGNIDIVSCAGGVEAMGLGEAEPGPVVLRPAPGPLLYGKSGSLQCLIQGPSGRVHGRRVPERSLVPGEDLRQQIRIPRKKRLDRAGSLSFVEWTTAFFRSRRSLARFSEHGISGFFLSNTNTAMTFLLLPLRAS